MISFSDFVPSPVDSTTVKATSAADASVPAWQAASQLTSLSGVAAGNAWVSSAPTNQRFHVDLGEARFVTAIRYDDYHYEGNYTDNGAKDFTLWGSNSAADFADLVYANDGTWTQIGTGSSRFVQHRAFNGADTHYVAVAPEGTFRYFALKMPNNWGSGYYIALRRLTFMGYAAPVAPAAAAAGFALPMRGRSRMR